MPITLHDLNELHIAVNKDPNRSEEFKKSVMNAIRDKVLTEGQAVENGYVTHDGINNSRLSAQRSYDSGHAAGSLPIYASKPKASHTLHGAMAQAEILNKEALMQSKKRLAASSTPTNTVQTKPVIHSNGLIDYRGTRALPPPAPLSAKTAQTRPVIHANGLIDYRGTRALPPPPPP